MLKDGSRFLSMIGLVLYCGIIPTTKHELGLKHHLHSDFELFFEAARFPVVWFLLVLGRSPSSRRQEL